MAEFEVTDQSLHPLGCIWLHGILLCGTAKILHLFLSLPLELLSVWVEYILAEGVLLKCVANGLHCWINLEMNVHHYRSLRSVEKDWDWYRYWYSLGTANTANKMYDVRIIAGIAVVSLFSGWLITTCCCCCCSVFCEYVFTSAAPTCLSDGISCDLIQPFLRICQQSAYESLTMNPNSTLSNENCTKLMTKKNIYIYC